MVARWLSHAIEVLYGIYQLNNLISLFKNDNSQVWERQ